ncbi:hypothetical protein EKL30_15480 [Candidimonas sp. SYP-B2681]|nr:hypothetical protein EKL30_15480 [Candidimonas sp. SYP-B2681]
MPILRPAFWISACRHVWQLPPGALSVRPCLVARSFRASE